MVIVVLEALDGSVSFITIIILHNTATNLFVNPDTPDQIALVQAV